RPAVGDRRGPTQSDLARYRAASLGTASPRLLDIDNARPAVGRDQSVALDLFRDRGASGRLRAGSDGVARERLAPWPRSCGAGATRIRRSDRPLLPDTELHRAVARRRVRGGDRNRGARDAEGGVLVLY